MLDRAAGLRRQWGLRWRKVGVFVRRVGDATDDGSALKALLAQAAAQELAGIAVTGKSHALGPYEDAGTLSDDLGLFLVLCDAT
jgi:hypothetical protein